MQNHFSEIPLLNPLFTYLIASLLSCQFSITVEEIVFIINPILLGAPLVLMRGDVMLVNGSGYFEICTKPLFTFAILLFYFLKMDLEEILKPVTNYFMRHLKTGLKIAVVFYLVGA